MSYLGLPYHKIQIEYISLGKNSSVFGSRED